jgi:hypothetical protein
MPDAKDIYVTRVARSGGRGRERHRFHGHGIGAGVTSVCGDVIAGPLDDETLPDCQRCLALCYTEIAHALDALGSRGLAVTALARARQVLNETWQR